MNATKRLFATFLVLTAVCVFFIACSPNPPDDGSSSSQKKLMTEEEYRSNQKALNGMLLAEGYAISQTGETARAVKSPLVREFKYTSDTSLSSDKVRSVLKEKEGPFYTELARQIPSGINLTVRKGSSVSIEYDEATGITSIAHIDLEIIIDGKTIEIEKDAKEKWIEIDGTFFDNSEFEKMLESAEAAADAIEAFFKNLKLSSLDTFRSVVDNGKQSVTIKVEDDGEIEAVITASYNLGFSEKTFTLELTMRYEEKDDETESFDLEASFAFPFATINDVFDILVKEDGVKELFRKAEKSQNVSIKINGRNIWLDAFYDEMD